MKELLINNIEIIKYGIFYGIIILTFSLIYFFKKDWFEKIYKHRYKVGIIILLISVLLEISGSSIGCWNQILGGEDGVILGKSRSIRGDEWGTFTPMTFSQKYNKTGEFKYFSDTIRADKTDTFIVYGQPVWNIAMIYRFFQIGFLLFGLGKGLAFFWAGRYIFLFLVSFDMLQIITKNKRGLSFIGAILITFSPIINWWFAINGLAEMLIFGQLSVILLDKYMKEKSYKKRWIYLTGIAISAGTYLLTFYPAWQVPLIYVVLALALWRIIENWKECKIEKKDVISIITVLVLFIISIVYIFSKSLDTVKAVLGTAYPGARCETGGGMGHRFFSYPMGLLFGIKESGLSSNVCEESLYYDFFPIGLILTAIVFFKYKIKDKLLIILTVIIAFLGAWCTYGFPEIIAKITLLSNSQASRTFIATGIINIFMLIRAISLLKEPRKVWVSVLISLAVTMITIYIQRKVYPNYMTNKITLVIASLTLIMTYLILRYQTKLGRILSIITITTVMCIAGGIVNPIRRGVTSLYNLPIVQEIKKVNDQEEGKWIVEEIGYPVINLPMIVGASTINTTNVYPDLERWYKLDENKQYEDIYNRYAHITTSIHKDVNEDKFELLNPDVIKVNLTIEDLKNLEVKYILTSRDLEQLNTDQVKFELKANNVFKIYEIKFE